MFNRNDNDNKESKLREEFKRIIMEYNDDEEIVDNLLNILKRDYILLFKKEYYCRDCFNCHDNGVYTNCRYYCKYYQREVLYGDKANDCLHFLNGSEEARKTMAHFHNSLTGDLFYE